MSKRFISTELFNDTWFMDLKLGTKLFYIYLITSCDTAGIIQLNWRLAEFQTGIKGLANSYQTVIEELGNRITQLHGDYYLLTRFARFQNPKGLNESVKPQKAVIDRLSQFGIDHKIFYTLSQQYDNSLITVQDKDRNKEKDKEEGICDFDDFWEAYHFQTKKPKTDREPALKKWNRLSAHERVKSFEMIAAYAKTNEARYLKKARTYLEDKTFNDDMLPNLSQASMKPETNSRICPADSLAEEKFINRYTVKP